MKKILRDILSGLLIFGLTNVALASTSFNYIADSGGGWVCTPSGTEPHNVGTCTGYTTDLSPNIVSEVVMKVLSTSSHYTVDTTINGVTYEGTATKQGGLYTAKATDNSGRTATIGTGWLVKSFCPGKFQCHRYYYSTNGSVTLP